jgi:hemerythrin-like domain-containing protein
MGSDAFEQLLRSHRRLEERLADLPVAAEDLAGPKREQALAWIGETAAWMNRAVRRHEEDEERSLFPRLAGRPELAPSLSKLADEHRAHERLHARLAQAETLPPEEVKTVVRELVAAYRRHIEEEEQVLFPAARAALDDAALAEMQAEMDARRGR